MNPNHRASVVLVSAFLGLALLFTTTSPVLAHVNYATSLYSDATIIDPNTGVLGTGNVNSSFNTTASSNAGWAAGQDATTWGNSHDNRFLYFNLAETSTIDFTITGTNTNTNGVLNPGYSIFSGVLVAPSSHDGAIVPASYIGAQSGFATWSPFAGANAAITANGGTLTTQHWGQYRSNADFTMANNSSVVRTLTYTGLSGSNASGSSVSGQYTLGPGVYSLIVGGANPFDLSTYLAHAIATNGNYDPLTGGTALAAYNADRLARTFNIQFAVAAVPVPAAIYLFGSGLAGIVAFARRRMVA